MTHASVWKTAEQMPIRIIYKARGSAFLVESRGIATITLVRNSCRNEVEVKSQ